jgi:hypothetical protein
MLYFFHILDQLKFIGRLSKDFIHYLNCVKVVKVIRD